MSFPYSINIFGVYIKTKILSIELSYSDSSTNYIVPIKDIPHVGHRVYEYSLLNSNSPMSRGQQSFVIRIITVDAFFSTHKITDKLYYISFCCHTKTASFTE